jgi:hypothetical protein
MALGSSAAPNPALRQAPRPPKQFALASLVVEELVGNVRHRGLVRIVETQHQGTLWFQLAGN